MRSFQSTKAQRSRCPLLLGIVGPSGCGKTYSALRMGSGIARAMDGPLYFIDTEAGRALHYSDEFDFQHVRFDPPFGPLDYIAAIDFCIKSGAKCVVVDSMTHEHSGEGGVLSQSETALDAWCGEDEKARNRNLARSFIKPKAQRRKLINAILQHGADAAFIFCFRANEKLNFKRKDENNNPREMGYQPETTSPLMYEMAQQFLLKPGCDGVPELRPSIPEEKMIVKTPSQFRGWFTEGIALSEEIGERFARWAMGDKPGATTASTVDQFNADVAAIRAAANLAILKKTWTEIHKRGDLYNDQQYVHLEGLKNEMKEVLANA